MKSPQKAFTLVEMMVVVTIVIIIASLAIPNLIRAKVSANEASAKGTLKLISNALENYAAINQNYPTNTTALMGVTPPYLSIDYFSTTYNGYVFSANLSVYTYVVTAAPAGQNFGSKSFTLTTGGVIFEN